MSPAADAYLYNLRHLRRHYAAGRSASPAAQDLATLVSQAWAGMTDAERAEVLAEVDAATPPADRPA